MKNFWVFLFVLAVAVLFSVPGAQGTWGYEVQNRNTVADLETGKAIVVKLHKGQGKKVKGSFVASDAEGITVRGKNGDNLTVTWDKIQKVRKQKWYNFWAGLPTRAFLGGGVDLINLPIYEAPSPKVH